MVLDYIKELLASQNQVIVPELGGFIVMDLPAEVAPNGNLLPARKLVLFSERLKSEPSNLLDLISAKTGQSKEDAWNQVQGFNYEIRNQLQNKGYSDLNEMGRLYINEQHELVFDAQVDLNLQPDSFGLREVKFGNIIPAETSMKSHERKSAAHSKHTHSADTPIQDEEEIPYGVPNQFATELVGGPDKKSALRIWLLGIPLVAILLVYLYFKAFDPSKRIVSANEKSVVKTEAEMQALVEESGKPVASLKEDQVENQTSSATEPTAKPQESTPAAANTGTKPEIKPAAQPATTLEVVEGLKFYVVVASLSSGPKAFSLRKKLLKDGHEDIQVLDPAGGKGNYRVVFGEYENLEEAKSIIAEKQSYFKEALWVLKLK